MSVSSYLFVVNDSSSLTLASGTRRTCRPVDTVLGLGFAVRAEREKRSACESCLAPAVSLADFRGTQAQSDDRGAVGSSSLGSDLALYAAVNAPFGGGDLVRQG